MSKVQLTLDNARELDVVYRADKKAVRLVLSTAGGEIKTALISPTDSTLKDKYTMARDVIHRYVVLYNLTDLHEDFDEVLR